MPQKMIPLVDASGRLATMLIDAAATRPWNFAESQPPMAVGIQAAKNARP